MTFSDGLPVQFWLTGCETYNEKEVEGINHACWCQPFNCDDEINIQFQAEESFSGAEYSILVKDASGSILTTLLCDEIDEGVFATSLIPSEYDLCDQFIQLVIQNNLGLGEEILANSDFEDTLEPWENIDGSPGSTWTLETDGGHRAACTIAVGVAESDPLRQDFGEQAAGDYLIEFIVLLSGTRTNTYIINAYNSGSLVQEIYNETSLVTMSEFTTFQKIVTISAPFDRIELVVSKTTGAQHIVNLTKLSLKSAAEVELAKSDCIHIKTSHAETELIEYSNNRNYAGLIYSDNLSPIQTFFLRVPSVFFHPRFPQESRAIERTNSTVVTSSKLKRERLLQVKHAPGYFHEKLILALSHHNVEIDGKMWKKENAYEMDDGDIHYPLKKATVYLTEKNFLARNVL